MNNSENTNEEFTKQSDPAADEDVFKKEDVDLSAGAEFVKETPAEDSASADEPAPADAADSAETEDAPQKPTKPKKKSWRSRSVPERLVTLIPAVIMFAVFIVAEWQMEIGAIYTTEFKLSLGLVAAAMVIGIFCIRLGKIPGWILTLATPALSFLLVEYFTHNPFDIKPVLIQTNLVLFYGACAFILFLTGSMKAAVVVTAAVPMVFGIANYYTLELRGTPLFPWDIASAGIAADVADNYEFIIDWHVCFIICSFLFIIMLGFLCTPRIRVKKWWFLRAPIALIAAVAVASTGSYVQSDAGVKELGMYPYLFTPKVVYNRNGAAVTFAYTLQYAGVPKPDGYSTASLEALMADYEAEPVNKEEALPNVIVIMNEAFSDLSTAADFDLNREVIPYISSLTENTVKGTAHVSVKGGNTANSEFEFLTGLSMAHFSPGSIPYQQYLTGETPSLASQLLQLGYETVAMHPYGATGWNRDKVYEWFGFNEFLASSDFKGYEKLRNYYSDAATYQKIIELYEAKDEGEPLFVFDVTMQNHGGYTTAFDNFDINEIYVSGLPRTGVTNTYLALMKKSDEAFSELVEYFNGQDEPTVILMFGDHQPNDNVVKPIWNKIGDKVEVGTLDEQLRRYTVPFVMTANFDIEEESDVDVSLNYLASLLCEKAGIPRTKAQMYLSALYEEYPVITAGHYGDAEGNYYDAIAMNGVDAINDYAMLAYNMVADADNLLEELFTYN